MTTALITHPDCIAHATPAHVDDQAARLGFVLRALEDLPLVKVEAPLAGKARITALHDAEYVARIESSIPASGFAILDAETDGETALCPTSWSALMRAVGAVQMAIDLVMSGQAGNAFAAIRPPGHHAEAARPMGFCIFGNVALGARYALDRYGLSRVAIVDFDVHHGNGTQALLWDEPRVLTVTSQQMPLWPGTGYPSETGAHGNVLNVPLVPGSGGIEMRETYERVVLPRLDEFAPELLLISAGFDAHTADPLADLNWHEGDYTWLTQALCDVADAHCGGRLVSTLEGGYDLDALAASVAAHVKVLTERSG